MICGRHLELNRVIHKVGNIDILYCYNFKNGSATSILICSIVVNVSVALKLIPTVTTSNLFSLKVV